MNREIKYRVRNKATGELIGYERINAGGHWEQQRVNRQEWLLGVITDGQIALELIREQYTGLKDKNGKEIYEGDILAHTGDTRLSKWLVIFKHGCFGVQNIHIDGTTHYNEFWPINSEYFFIDREIVANTHQPIADE